MRMPPVWRGVRMREVAVSADPDLPPRDVTLPAAWDDAAASALAALAPGEAPVSLLFLARGWSAPLAEAARGTEEAALTAALHALLLARRAAPAAPAWRGEPARAAILNLSAFHAPETGFDAEGLAQAAGRWAAALALGGGPGSTLSIAVTGLDGLLAAAGFGYDREEGRATAAAVSALVRAAATEGVLRAWERGQGNLLSAPPAWPAAPPCPLPGVTQLADALRARLAVPPGLPPLLAVAEPSPVEALLGVETSGIAPAFGPVVAGRLTQAARDRLAASGVSPEAALALSLLGEDPLPAAGIEAWTRMHDALSPWIETMPARPRALPRPPRLAPREALPARSRGTTQKVAVGGHRVFLTTSEYADGRLGAIALALPKAGPALRGMADQFAAAFSLGLQHGVALETLIEAFAGTRFGPAGVVEGDPDVGYASSIPDYVARSLAAQYLGRRLPEPIPDALPGALAATGTENAPMLPLDMPPSRRLRLVK